MKQNEKAAKLKEAVETGDLPSAGRVVVEMLLDDEVSVSDLAADFIEDEVGHYDWVNNWAVVKSRGNPVQKVQDYLDRYSLLSNAQAIVNTIDNMAKENPGRWK